jgi:hypothetical protein
MQLLIISSQSHAEEGKRTKIKMRMKMMRQTNEKCLEARWVRSRANNGNERQSKEVKRKNEGFLNRYKPKER